MNAKIQTLNQQELNDVVGGTWENPECIGGGLRRLISVYDAVDPNGNPYTIRQYGATVWERLTNTVNGTKAGYNVTKDTVTDSCDD